MYYLMSMKPEHTFDDLSRRFNNLEKRYGDIFSVNEKSRLGSLRLHLPQLEAEEGIRRETVTQSIEAAPVPEESHPVSTPLADIVEDYLHIVEARRREIQINKWRREKKEMLVGRYKKGLSTKHGSGQSFARKHLV